MTEQTRKVFMKRTASIYSGMKKRPEAPREFPFMLEDFRVWVLGTMHNDDTMRCHYSHRLLTVDDFSVDHLWPVSGGGDFGFGNIVICSEAENLRKGDIDPNAYSRLREFVNGLMPTAQESIWRRLEVGDVQRGAWWRRENKKRKENQMKVVRHAR